MGGSINFNDEESVRQYCLNLREKVKEKCGIPCEVLTGFDNLIVIFGETHVFNLSANNATETKRGKIITYDSIQEWETEVITTSMQYMNAGLTRIVGYVS